MYREESSGVNEQENMTNVGENDKDDEMEANSREDHELEILAEAIGTATEAEQGVASAEIVGGAAVSVSKSATSMVREVSVNDPCEGQSSRVVKNFWKVLE